MKRNALAIFLALSLVMSLCACVRVKVEEPDTQNDVMNRVVQQGYFTFTIQPDGTYSVKATDRTTLPTEIVIPDTCNGIAVTSIGDYAFSGCENLESVTLPNSITTIEGGAFYNCSALTGITVPEGVTSIGEGAFALCEGLESITIPNSVTSVGTSVFMNCNALAGTTYEKAIYLGNAQNPHLYLWKATDINTVKPSLHPSVRFVDHKAFDICTALIGTTYENAIYLGNEQTPHLYLWKAVDTSINEVSIHPSAKIIGCNAFQQCNNLVEITIPEGVVSISDHAFLFCERLQGVAVAEGNPTYYSEGNCLIKKADKSLVVGCKSSIIPNDVTSIGIGAFRGCTGLTSIIIPNSVKSIGDGAFFACSSLVSITVPDSVKRIGANAFGNCTSLEGIIIPDSVMSMGDRVFSNCNRLAAVYYMGAADDWEKLEFDGKNTDLQSTTVFYLVETQPTDTTHKYWHYENDVPTAW